MRSSNWAGHIRLTALGVLLCLLAAVFAVEAKLAWYSPNSSDVQISATKLRADDAPREVLHAPAALTPARDIVPEFAVLLAVALFCVCTGRLIEFTTSAPRHAWSPGTFPPLFLRPPPVL